MDAAIEILEGLVYVLPAMNLLFWVLDAAVEPVSLMGHVELSSVSYPVYFTVMLFTAGGLFFGKSERARALCALIRLVLLIRLGGPLFHASRIMIGPGAWLYSPNLFGDLWMITAFVSAALRILIYSMQLIASAMRQQPPRVHTQ